MAEKSPICIYGEALEELRSGDTLPGFGTADLPETIWAEENGPLANGTREWSFGNGSTGTNNVYAMYDGKIKKVFIHAETPGTTADIDVMINDVIADTASFSANGVVTLGTPIDVSEGDAIGFRTNTVTGTWTDVRVGVSLVRELSGLKGDPGPAGSVDSVTAGTGLSDSGTATDPIINHDPHTGDVTGATVLTVANNAVTYAKMQDVSAASRVLGRGDSGSGDPEELSLGPGLAITGTTLDTVGGGGDPFDNLATEPFAHGGANWDNGTNDIQSHGLCQTRDVIDGSSANVDSGTKKGNYLRQNSTADLVGAYINLPADSVNLIDLGNRLTAYWGFFSTGFGLQFHQSNGAFFCGLTDQSGDIMLETDDPAGNYVGLQYVHSIGTAFRFIIKDGTTQATHTSTVTVANSTYYGLSITCNNNATQYTLRIFDEDNTVLDSHTFTANVPGEVAAHGMIGAIRRTGAGGTRSYGFKSFNVRVRA